ncbi:hypothetical protein KQ945_08550 [Bacillus subtilis subsp. subtilis]|nr:hypothetical protein [Bacillus subtilis subsp. subtilis]
MKKQLGQLAVALGRSKAKKTILAVGGAVCVAAWATVVISAAIGIGTTTRIVLLSVALLVTEAVFWGAAALLGMTVMQLRRNLFGKRLPKGRDDAA